LTKFLKKHILRRKSTPKIIASGEDPFLPKVTQNPIYNKSEFTHNEAEKIAEEERLRLAVEEERLRLEAEKERLEAEKEEERLKLEKEPTLVLSPRDARLQQMKETRESKKKTNDTFAMFQLDELNKFLNTEETKTNERIQKRENNQRAQMTKKFNQIKKKSTEKIKPITRRRTV